MAKTYNKDEILKEMELEGVDYGTAQLTLASKEGILTCFDDIPAGTLIVDRKNPRFQMMVVKRTEKNIVTVQPDGRKRLLPWIRPEQFKIIGWQEMPKGYE